MGAGVGVGLGVGEGDGVVPGFVGDGEAVLVVDVWEVEPHATSTLAMLVARMSDPIREIIRGLKLDLLNGMRWPRAGLARGAPN